MRIESSAIAMSGKTTFTETNSKQESLKAWAGNKSIEVNNQTSSTQQTVHIQADILELSDEAKAMSLDKSAEAGKVDSPEDTFELSDKDKLKIQLITDFIKALTGKTMKFYVMDKQKFKQNKIELKVQPQHAQSLPTSQTTAQPQKMQGWGLSYEYHEYHQEQEKMSFDSSGTIKTADGKEINFSMQLNMSREFVSRQDVSLKAGDATRDPLVINFDGNSPALTNTKFSFDLDNDGKKDQISFVKPGSGFLALDLNNDGTINNGGELFGPKSGDGFGDLSKFDSDGNNWIDENDAIFDKLRIWTKDSDGNDKLFALGQKGIGAIYLGNVDTNFSMKNDNNDLLGKVRETGIFVKENGTVGTIQHIDLAV